MTAAVTRQDSETYLPSTDEADQVASVYDFLATHERAARERLAPRYFLAGAGLGDQVEIPEEIHQVLLKVADALRNGLAVTVAPQATRLTTQQAADLLGVTRPTVIKILDAGEMPFERAGTHRRLLLGDVLAYRERRRKAQYDVLDSGAIDIADDAELDPILEGLRAARKATATARRASARG